MHIFQRSCPFGYVCVLWSLSKFYVRYFAAEMGTFVVQVSQRGMTFEEMTAAIANQASVPVDQTAVRRAVETILEEVSVVGNHLKHKNAVA